MHSYTGALSWTLQPQFNYPDATYALQNTTDMEVTLPPLQAPRVVQDDSIADVTLRTIAYIKETWIASRVWPRPAGLCSDRASRQTMMASRIQHEGQAADAILPDDESAVRRSCTGRIFLAIITPSNRPRSLAIQAEITAVQAEFTAVQAEVTGQVHQNRPRPPTLRSRKAEITQAEIPKGRDHPGRDPERPRSL
ncbi:hypothetical protein LSAT2_014794 [Lamellibrachia satsuma]|nr:hypothetical protein LSAT2_014794 [Lamellibrachia satsuma]